MPHDLRWFEPRLVLRRLWGHVDGAQLAASFHRVLGDPRFDALRLNLVDLTGVTSTDVSDSQIELMAATVYGAAHMNPGLQVALIAPHEVARDLARRYLAIGISPYPVQRLGSYGEANAWLARHGATLRLGNKGEPNQV